MSSTVNEMITFGEQLRAIRLGFNLTQLDVEDLSREIADRDGCQDFIVRNAQLSSIEHGRSLPGPAKLLTLAAIYGLTVNQLMTLWAAIKPRGDSREAG